MARAHALVRSGGGRGTASAAAPTVDADGDACAVAATAALALVGRHRALDALPPLIALAKPLDALAMGVAVGGAARRRVLTPRARKAWRAHAHLAEAVSTSRAAQRTSCATTARQQPQHLPHRGRYAGRLASGSIRASGRRETVAAEAAALSSWCLRRGRRHAGHARAVGRAAERAADCKRKLAPVTSKPRVASARASRRVTGAMTRAVCGAHVQNGIACATTEAGVASARAAIAVAMPRAVARARRQSRKVARGRPRGAREGCIDGAVGHHDCRAAEVLLLVVVAGMGAACATVARLADAVATRAAHPASRTAERAWPAE